MANLINGGSINLTQNNRLTRKVGRHLKNLIYHRDRVRQRARRWIDSQLYPPLRPSCIGIGAQKAGTSALFRYLSSHPFVKKPIIKELNFFNCRSRYIRGYGFYHSFFPPRKPGITSLFTFDVTPEYLTHPQSAQRIYQYDPSIKLLALLRDPVTRAYSAWQMHRRLRAKDPDWFFNWWDMCDSNCYRESFVRRSAAFGQDFKDDIIEELRVRDQGKKIEHPMLTQGMYCNQIEVYFEYFTREQILIISSERFFGETVSVLHEIEKFVGMPAHSWDPFALKPVHVGEYNRDAMPSDARAILRSFYKDQNQRLYSLLDRDFGWM